MGSPRRSELTNNYNSEAMPSGLRQFLHGDFLGVAWFVWYAMWVSPFRMFLNATRAGYREFVAAFFGRSDEYI